MTEKKQALKVLEQNIKANKLAIAENEAKLKILKE